ncbi:MAG: VanZ family protein [Burkholderiales bacterium]|nr:VanZ family protein [Burkholderiales bacterium]
MNGTQDERPNWGRLALGLALFIAYGSLLPFHYVPRSLESALAHFRSAPVQSVDLLAGTGWVANLLIYAALAFPVTAWAERARGKTKGTALAVLLAGAMAIAVEFAQIWFPPRTVSLNDLVAEFIGIGIGIVLWHGAGRKLTSLHMQLHVYAPSRARALFLLYVAAYIIASLMPFDFVLSPHELQAKLASGSDGLWLPASTCSSAVSCLSGFGAELLSTIPIGILLSVLIPGWRLTRVALLVGLALGVMIELMQVLLASASGNGISILTRTLGVVAGTVIVRSLTSARLQRIRPFIRPLVLGAALIYLGGALALQDLHDAELTAFGFSDGLEKLSWLPFYYHNYMTEANALRSLILTAMLYAPVGILLWAWRYGSGWPRASGRRALLVAMGLAALMEAGKLLLPGTQPDPANVLIAAIAGWLGYVLTRQFAILLANPPGARKLDELAPLPLVPPPTHD